MFALWTLCQTMMRRVIGAAKSAATVALKGVRCVFEQRKTLNTVERLRTTTNKCMAFATANLEYQTSPCGGRCMKLKPRNAKRKNAIKRRYNTWTKKTM